MTATALSEADQLEVVARYGKGQTVEQLAVRFDVSEASILRALDRAGVGRRPRGFQRRYPDSLDATVLALRGEGASWAEIAAAVGMKPGGVRKRYDRACRSQD